MKFLIDAQLPPSLAPLLTSLGHEARHVADLGLASAPDAEIWAHAESSGAAILTKDEDFALKAATSGAAGPFVVWLRIGNCGNRALMSRLPAILPEVMEAWEAGERLVEVR